MGGQKKLFRRRRTFFFHPFVSFAHQIPELRSAILRKTNNNLGIQCRFFKKYTKIEKTIFNANYFKTRETFTNAMEHGKIPKN